MGQDFVKAPCQDGYEFRTSTPTAYPITGSTQDSMVVRSFDLEGKYIEEAIGDKYLKWSCRTPVFIDAPTGSGKSTFVCHGTISIG